MKLITCFIWLFFFVVSMALTAQEETIINTEAVISIKPAEKVNTKHLEFAPQYYGDGIVFVHAKDQEKFIDRKIGTPYFEIMYSDLGGDGMPIRSVNFSSNIRTKFHEGPASFNKDQDVIYFTRSNYSNGQEIKGADGKAHMKIYSAQKGPEDWLEITEVPFCSDDFDTWGPALSPDGNAMVFVSNRPGSLGGMDLFISSQNDGAWTEPVNLGSAVNTDGNEAFPFWHPSGVLFFAANKRPEKGMGGFDVYAVTITPDGVVSDPVILPAPINSKWDDLTFICDEAGTSGFFASSRKGGKGKDDLYRFEADPGILNTIASAESEIPVAGNTTQEGIPDCVPIEAFIVDHDSGEPIPGAVVTLQDTCNNITRIFGSDEQGLYADCHKPGCSYKIFVEKEGYHDQHSIIVPVAGNARTTIFMHKVALVESPEDVKEGDTIVLKNIYYDFNKSAIRKGDAVELAALVNLMNERADMKIELQSHTDSRGSAGYNMELSERRAISAYEFLISRGIKKQRVRIRPMGETALVNGCSDGVECTEEQHQENRRTEIHVLQSDSGM